MEILSIIKQYLNIIIAISVAIISFYLSSIFYNNKINKIKNDFNNYKVTTEKNIQEQKILILNENNRLQNEKDLLDKKLKDLENENYKNYTELQKANSVIKSNVANGNNRLYINAKCPKSEYNSSSKTENNTTSVMDDGKTSRAVIDSRDAETIISITEKADKYKAQLEALQNWVNILLVEMNK